MSQNNKKDGSIFEPEVTQNNQKDGGISESKVFRIINQKSKDGSIFEPDVSQNNRSVTKTEASSSQKCLKKESETSTKGPTSAKVRESGFLLCLLRENFHGFRPQRLLFYFP
jgi:hypothetical protein